MSNRAEMEAQGTVDLQCVCGASQTVAVTAHVTISPAAITQMLIENAEQTDWYHVEQTGPQRIKAWCSEQCYEAPPQT